MKIDTDTRQLRRDADGYYYASRKLPCAHCGHTAVCSLSGVPHKCSLFLPTLPFTDETGMQKVFNTIRVGKAWTERLTQYQVVALYNPKRSEIFGHAMVLAATAGPIVDMLHQHAHANHLMLSEQPQEAPSILHRWLRQNYGPRIIHETTRITAVYLLRQHFAPAAPSVGWDEEDRKAEGLTAGSRQDP